MIYVIMCGGYYQNFAETPKQLCKVGGETLVDRTIRLLQEAGVTAICITSNDERFEGHGVPVLHHENTYRYDNGQLYGYWLDAFYPHFDPEQKVTFLFGDVLYTPAAIDAIVHCDRPGNILFGSWLATNKLGANWGEPFAYVVNDYKTFMEGVKAVKDLYDIGAVDRNPIVWELYRYLNGLEINRQAVLEDTFIVIDDGTIDADDPERFEEWNRMYCTSRT